MLLLVFLFFSSLQAHEGVGVEGEEAEIVSHLIAATEGQLEGQRELLKLMRQFLDQKRDFLKGEEEKKTGDQLVQTSKKILALLEKEHLKDLFSGSYLDELQFFSSFTH